MPKWLRVVAEVVKFYVNNLRGKRIPGTDTTFPSVKPLPEKVGRGDSFVIHPDEGGVGRAVRRQ